MDDVRTGTLGIAGAMLLGSLGGVTYGQNVRFVDGSAASGGDGLSWETAYDRLHLALDEAAGVPAIDEIWVAAGVYRPDRGSRDRGDTFVLLSDLGVYGGFAGGESEREQRDPEANETILSGDLAGNDGPNALNNGENSYHVLRADHVDESAILDGFTVTGGHAVGAEVEEAVGGGIRMFAASPHIRRCRFVNNAAVGGAGLEALGGHPVISGCRFVGNLAESGGAGLSATMFGDSGGFDVTVTDCDFIDNRAPYGYGGAVLTGGSPFDNETAQDLTFVRCRFERNSARFGGALRDSNGRNFTMIDCTFTENGDLSDVLDSAPSGACRRRITSSRR